MPWATLRMEGPDMHMRFKVVCAYLDLHRLSRSVFTGNLMRQALFNRSLDEKMAAQSTGNGTFQDHTEKGKTGLDQL